MGSACCSAASAHGIRARTSRSTLTLGYSNSPVLTTCIALTGQGVDSVDALRDCCSDSEIRDPARDRTATSKLVTPGVSRLLHFRNVQ